MKLTALIQLCGPALLVTAALTTAFLLSGCGSTIYGMGVDLERIGNRMQGNGQPSPGNQAQVQNYPQQAPNSGAWSYYQ